MVRDARRSNDFEDASGRAEEGSRQGARTSREWRALWAMPFITLGLSAAITALSPASYRATCVLQYEPEQSTRSGEPLVDALAREEWYRTQDYRLRADGLLRRVLRASAAQPAPFASAEIVSERRAIERLRAEIYLKRIDGTRLMQLTVADGDPTRAAALANSLCRNYLEQALEERTAAAGHAVAWLTRQVLEAEDRLAQSENELHAHVEHKRDAALPRSERQRLVAEEITQLRQSLTTLQQRGLELSARLDKLKRARRDDPFETHTVEIDANSQVRALHDAFLAASLELRDAVLLSGETSPAANTARARVEGLRTELRHVLEGFTHAAEGELVEAQSVSAQLEVQLERASNEARDLELEQLEMGRVERRREEAFRWLKALRERASAAEIAGATRGLVATVIEPATAPQQPTRTWLRNLLLGAGLGVAAALLLAWRRRQ